MRIFLILLTLGLPGCSGRGILEKHNSPTGEYVIQVELDNSEPGDEHIAFRLLNKSGNQLDYIRTLSGDHMKWSVNWFDRNTIVLHSHDVETYSWKIENNKLVEIGLTDEINVSSIEAFDIKYNVEKHLDACLKPITEYEKYRN